HHRHRAGRPRHLYVRATEHRGDQTGGDRGHDPGFGTEPGRDAERERERQRDDADGDAGDEVLAPRQRQLGVITTAWYEPPQSGDERSAAHLRLTPPPQREGRPAAPVSPRAR